MNSRGNPTARAWAARAMAGWALALMAATPSIAPAQAPGTAAQAPSQNRAMSDYIRVVEEDGGQRVKLQTSARTFEPGGPGPVVHLVGVTHIGDRKYYDALQEFLDAQDVVLYEGVKPAAVGQEPAGAKDDDARRKLTERRLRLLATMMEKQKAKAGAYPASLDELAASLPRPHARLARGAMVDGWGHAVILAPPPAGGDDAKKPGAGVYDLVSLGADGAAGGDAAGADLRLSDQKPLTKSEIGSSQDGIQVQLARALGLEFQLLAIDYERASWRDSDMSIDAVQKKLEESGQSGEALFRLLDGSSLTARFAGFILGFVQSSKHTQSMAKLMMVEMLSRADELVNAGAMGPMMKVIVLDRNEAVFEDLKKIISDEKQVRSVALFYGGGHIPDMESRLRDMGYRLTGERWFTGVDMNIKEAGLTTQQAAQMRRMMSQSLDQQLKRAPGKRGADAPAKDNSDP